MMRQVMSERKTRRIAEQVGLKVVRVMVRGNTRHRRDLCLVDGSIATLWPDGSVLLNRGRWMYEPLDFEAWLEVEGKKALERVHRVIGQRARRALEAVREKARNGHEALESCW